MSTKIREYLVEIEQLIYERGEYKKAQKIIETIEKKKEITEEESLETSIFKCQIFTKQGEFKKSIQLLGELKKKAEVLNNDILLVDVLIEKAEAVLRVGDYQTGLEILNRAEIIIEKIENVQDKEIQQRIGFVTIWKAGTYWMLADYNQAISLAHKALKHFEKSKKKYHIAYANLIIGSIYSSKGDLDLAINYLEQSKQNFEKIGNKREIALVLTNLAGIYLQTGNHKRSLTLLEESLKLREKIGNKQDLGITLSTIAEIQIITGENKKALSNLERAIQLMEEIRDTKYIHGYFRQIGFVYNNLGNKKLALEYLLKSLKLATQVEDHLNAARILKDLIIQYVEYDEEKQAKNYFDHLQLINNQIKSDLVNNLYHLSKALLLKMQDDARSRGKAEGILDYLISSHRISFNFRIQVLINLCELLLVEFHNTGKEEIFDDLSEKIDYLIEITKANQSVILLIEGYRLKSLLHLVKLDIIKSKQVLEKALVIAKEKELDKLKIEIQNDLQQISEKKPLWDKLKKEQKSLVEILKQTPLMNGMKRLAKESILNIEDRQTTEVIDQRKLFALKI